MRQKDLHDSQDQGEVGRSQPFRSEKPAQMPREGINEEAGGQREGDGGRMGKAGCSLPGKPANQSGRGQDGSAAGAGALSTCVHHSNSKLQNISHITKTKKSIKK